MSGALAPVFSSLAAFQSSVQSSKRRCAALRLRATAGGSGVGPTGPPPLSSRAVEMWASPQQPDDSQAAPASAAQAPAQAATAEETDVGKWSERYRQQPAEATSDGDAALFLLPLMTLTKAKVPIVAYFCSHAV